MTPDEKTRQQLLTEKIASASQRSLVIQVILVLSAFAGLCSSLFPALKSFGVSDGTAYLVTTIITGTAIVYLLAFYFLKPWKVYLVRATIVLLFVISLGLCGLLYWKQFIEIDEWKAWNEKVSAKVNECERVYAEARSKQKDAPSQEGKDADYERDYDQKVVCVGTAIQEKYPHQGEEGTKKISSLENDTRAGSYLMNNLIVFHVLETRLGVGDKFTGTGIAVPSDGRDYGDARLPEYLVPNMRETDSRILTWQINPQLPTLSRTVECLIVGCIKDNHEIRATRPSNITPITDVKKYKDVVDYAKNPANLVLLRLNQFNPTNDKGEKVYRGKLGRDNASRVFMIRLRDVWHVSLKEAIRLSGHKVDDTKSNETLFVWLYAPTAEALITQATWKNLIPNMDSLLRR